ncbi:MAG: anthranilate synthase component I family protein [Bacteroidota bacterium]
MLNETFEVVDFKGIKEQLLIWASQFSSCSFLDNNHYPSPWEQQECLVAAGMKSMFQAAPGTALEDLQLYLDSNSGRWIFGHICYDLKNEIENLPVTPPGKTGFETVCFYVPETIVQLSAGKATIYVLNGDPAAIWEQVTSTPVNSLEPEVHVNLQSRITRHHYLDTIEKIKEHIHRGDCYELNFCQEFFAENAPVDPVRLFRELNRFSPNPFSCYHKINDSHLVCASPERYLARKGNKLFSQPIKGTASRNLDDAADDALKLQELQTNQKERSENVMVVDLVRNDLSRICLEGTVKVDELFKIYSYPQVHQMVSTISGLIPEETPFTEIIRSTFPMGSMTGAPKKRVMELIAAYETGNRGLFSGTVGYISPSGDFDFNVVIRSLLFNAKTNYLSCWVGGGITWYSNGLAEYEECMLKAMAIKKVLQPAAPNISSP